MRIFGIPIKFHWSSAFLAILLIYNSGIWLGLLVSALILIFLLGHEVSHSLAARSLGYHTEGIVLWALGGAAFIKGMDQMSPPEVMRVALAGPLFNMVCFLVTMPLLIISPEPFSKVLSLIVVINFSMGIFNMIPAYPLDGGRTFLALMQMIGMESAINVAKIVSIISGSGVIIFGIIFTAPMIIITGILVCMIAVVKP